MLGRSFICDALLPQTREQAPRRVNAAADNRSARSQVTWHPRRAGSEAGCQHSTSGGDVGGSALRSQLASSAGRSAPTMYGMVSSQSGGKSRSMRRHQLSRQRTTHSLGGPGGSPRATPGCSRAEQPTASPSRSLSHRGGQRNVYGRLVGFLKHTWTGFTMAVGKHQSRDHSARQGVAISVSSIMKI